MSHNFSIIVGFRNRDTQRVKNSLDSLAAQTVKDFRLIFVDYGSDENVSAEIKPIVENYPFAKYIFNNTRGWFWNRAYALNTGIKLAKGNICVLWDIDLMVEPDFLEKLQNYNFEKSFTTHRSYYLPKNATISNYKSAKIIEKSLHSYVGLAAIQTNKLKQINGFDEFFQVWGAEDDDLYARMQNAGLKRKQIDASEIAVYHQWHPTQAPALPDMWYLQMVEYLFQTEKKARHTFGEILSSENRPALKAFQENSYIQLNEIELQIHNKTLLYNELINQFKNNKDVIGFYIDFHFPQMEFSGKAQKTIHWFNHLMKKRKLNFRLINQKQQERTDLKENIYSFFKYFIGTNRNKLKDYYLDWRDDGFLLILLKQTN